MYQYISLLLILWLTSASKVIDEEVEVKNRSPFISTLYQDFYRLPIKTRLTMDQKQEFYYNKKKDGRFFCPKENESTEESEDEDDDKTTVKHTDKFTYKNCLFEKKFAKKEKKLCESEVKPVIVEKKDWLENNIPCGETGYFYKVAYKVCLENSVRRSIYNKLRIKEISQKNYSTATATYEVCYDHSKNRVLFAKHKILSPYILRNLILDDERALHEFPQKYSTKTYGIENLKKLKNSVKAYEEQANSEDKQLLQMLVPTDDFALGHWMKTTFHIINYALLQESKAPIWNAINSYVRSRIIREIFDKIENPLIFTGTFGGQSIDENKDKLDLGNDQNSGIIKPEFWWKVLYSAKYRKGVVIIMHNNNSSKEICDPEVTACDVSKWKTEQLKEEDFQFVYCCSLSSASKSIPILKHLEIDLEHDVLKIG